MGFKIKRNPDGTISKYKAYLVAKDYHQVGGFDFKETFSWIVKPVLMIRVVLTIAISQGRCFRQVEVNNALLNGELEEAVFM